MAAPYRIRLERAKKVTSASDAFAEYMDRLMKMIPAGVVGLYLVAQGIVGKNDGPGLIVVTVICFIAVLVVMIWGTADATEGEKADLAHVGISAVSFLIWVYSIGGPFAVYHLQSDKWASLAIVFWTFFIPIFYKGK